MTAAAVTAAASPQWRVVVARCPAKPARDCMAMTSSEVPTAAGIGQAAEQGQRRDDEESAAGADQSGDEPTATPYGSDPGDRQIRRLRPVRVAAAAADHRDGGGEHHQRRTRSAAPWPG